MPKTGEICIMGKEGDIRTTWDKDDPDEVQAVRQLFDSLREKGFACFYVSEAGEEASEMEEFDPFAGRFTLIREFEPKAKRIVARPPVVGG